MKVKIIREQSGSMTVNLPGKKHKGLTVEEALRAIDAAYIDDITETLRQTELYTRAINSARAQMENAMKGLESVLDDFKRRHDPATAENTQGDIELSAVITAYMNTLGAFLSPEAVSFLKSEIKSMGKEVLLHALTVARDAGKTNWAYIRAILREWRRQGVTCMGDVQRLEEARAAAGDRPRWMREGKNLQPSCTGGGKTTDLAELERMIARI